MAAARGEQHAGRPSSRAACSSPHVYHTSCVGSRSSEAMPRQSEEPGSDEPGSDGPGRVVMPRGTMARPRGRSRSTRRSTSWRQRCRARSHVATPLVQGCLQGPHRWDGVRRGGQAMPRALAPRGEPQAARLASCAPAGGATYWGRRTESGRPRWARRRGGARAPSSCSPASCRDLRFARRSSSSLQRRSC